LKKIFDKELHVLENNGYNFDIHTDSCKMRDIFLEDAHGLERKKGFLFAKKRTFSVVLSGV